MIFKTTFFLIIEQIKLVRGLVFLQSQFTSRIKFKVHIWCLHDYLE